MKRFFLAASIPVLMACAQPVAPIDGRDDLEAVLATSPADTNTQQALYNQVLSVTPGLSLSETEAKLDAVDDAATRQGDAGLALLSASQLARTDKLNQFKDNRATDTAQAALDGLTRLGLSNSASALEAREALLMSQGHTDENEAELQAVLSAKTELYGPYSPHLAETFLIEASYASAAQDFDRIHDRLAQLFRVTDGQTDPHAIDLRIAAYTLGSSAYHDTTRIPEALSEAEAGLALAREHFDDSYPRLSEVLANYGAALYRSSRHQESADVNTEAVRVGRAQLDGDINTSLGIAMVNLAAAQHGLGHIETADALFMDAYEGFIGLGGDTNIGYAGASLDNAAKAANDLGRLQQADDRYVEAQRLLRDTLGEDHVNLAVSYLTHADTLYRLGEFERAEEVGTKAADRLDAAIGDDNIYSRLARSTALLAQAERDPDSVRASVMQQIDQAEAVMRQAVLSSEGWTQTATNMRMSLTQLSLASIAIGDMEAAFRALQMATLSSVSEADQRRALTRSLDTGDGAALAERLKDLQQQRQTRRTALTTALSRGEASGALSAEVAQLDTDIGRLSQQFFAEGDPSSLLGLTALSEAQAALNEGEALLMPMTYFRAEALLITADTVHYSRGDKDSARVRLASKDFAEVLAGSDPITPDHPFLSGNAAGLFGEAPMENIDTLYVVGKLLLGAAPLSLLQDPVQPGQFLGERVAISRLPTAAALLRPAPTELTKGFLGVGDPSFDGAPDETVQIASVGGLTDQS